MLMREISDRLGLEIWRAMGFEPIVESSGRLAKMIVRAWTDPWFYFLDTHLGPGTRSGDVHCIDGEVEDGREAWKLAIS